MARTINRLSAAQIAKTTKVGRYSDGGNLWLQVSAFGTKSWAFRFMLDGRARQMGLGSVNDFSLREARDLARAARQQVRQGIDPIEQRNGRKSSARAAGAKQITFAEASDLYIKAHSAGWRNPMHLSQWRNTLRDYALPILGDLDVAAIDVGLVLRVLEPIWQTKTVTASRLRGRLEAILDWSRVRGYRSAENPARWKGHLDHLLPEKGKVTRVTHHAALAYADLPEFMVRLRERETVSARALEFAILTAARTNEVRGATWDEVDLVAKVWTVPGHRMKGGREHRVALSGSAVAILEAVPKEAGNPHVFIGTRKGKGLASMTMLHVLRRDMTGMDNASVHGFRSTFRDWAAEETSFPREVAEAALAHITGSAVEYRRGDALELRRKLLEAWARYCSQPPAKVDGNVVTMRAKA